MVPAVPTIDEEACDGCDACASLCPTGAVRLETGADGAFYRLEAELCNGCGICRDVCTRDAVSITHLTIVSQRTVALRTERCGRCGVRYHLPAKRGGQICPTCLNSTRPRLHSVQGDYD